MKYPKFIIVHVSNVNPPLYQIFERVNNTMPVYEVADVAFIPGSAPGVLGVEGDNHPVDFGKARTRLAWGEKWLQRDRPLVIDERQLHDAQPLAVIRDAETGELVKMFPMNMYEPQPFPRLMERAKAFIEKFSLPLDKLPEGSK